MFTFSGACWTYFHPCWSFCNHFGSFSFIFDHFGPTGTYNPAAGGNKSEGFDAAFMETMFSTPFL